MDKPSYQHDEVDEPEEEEEKELSELLNSQQRGSERPDNLNETDDNVLQAFKIKYQKSLEAIQSFQEILELKKNYATIHHSYNPNNPLRKKEGLGLSQSATKPRIKQVINLDPLKPRLEPIYHLNPGKMNKVSMRSDYQSVNESSSPQMEASSRSKKSFRIRDTSLRGSHGSSAFHSPLESPSGIPGGDIIIEDTLESKQTPTNLPNLFSPIRSTIKIRQTARNLTSSFSAPMSAEKEIVSQKRQEPESPTGGQAADVFNETGPIDPSKMDEIMGEPYVKIKIKNLGNFRAEPLEDYDEALVYNEEDPMGMLNMGMNRGYSRFVNHKGETDWKECEIIGYLEDERKYLIRWKHDGTTKKVTRLNLRYTSEPEGLFEERLEKALNIRYKNLYMGSYKDMLQEKARGDFRLNYPYKSLNQIVKLAFGRIEKIEESELPLQLVDELMDYYKQEIVRFSLEIRSFQADLSAYAKKFTGAYRMLKNVPIVNQERALEVLNMPYKEYREYKDWAENTIIDSEEVDMFELSVFNDPTSQKMFFESMTKNSELRFIHSSEVLVKAYASIDFSNFLTMDENKLLIIPTRKSLTSKRNSSAQLEEDMIPLILKKEYDQSAYKTRAVLRRKIRLVDVNKLKAEYKLLKPHKRKDDNISFLVTAFKQAFNKILPKPLDFTTQFLNMVSSLLRQVSDIRLYRALCTYKKTNIIRAFDVFGTLQNEFNSDANKIELYIYRVQQCVDELVNDIKILKNESQEKETLERVCNYCTIMAHDSIKTCIKESLKELIDSLEEYYALLPLPTISKEIQKMLSQEIKSKRAEHRHKLSLPADRFDTSPTKDIDLLQNRRNTAQIAKGDKELMQTIILDIMTDIAKGGRLFKEGLIDIEALRVKPLFWMKYVIKGSSKNHPQKPKIKMTRQDRARQRLTSRENLYRFEEFKERLLSDHYRGDDAPDIKTSTPDDEKYVGKTAFNWYKLGKGMTTHEPHIYEVEEKLKKLIVSAFEVFGKLERIDTSTPPNDNFMTVEGLEDDLFSFRHRIDELFKMSLMPLLAVFSILNNFDFLLTQEKYYVSDVKEAFNDSPDKNIGIICKEIEDLQNDLDFVYTRLPKIFNLGFFLLDISEFVVKLKHNIEHYLQHLKDFLQLKLNEILTSSRAIVEKIEERLSRGAAVIDDYIELKLFLDSDELKQDMDSIKEGVDLSEQITNYIEVFSIDYNPDVLDTFYLSKGWINSLNKTKMNAQVQLEAARPRLISELRQKNEEIFRELDGIKVEISNYSNFYDLNNALQYFTNARFIMTRLDELVEYGTKCNFYEQMLVARKTDFTGIGIVKENFEKFFLLWEFIYDKWMIKSDYWLNSAFESIDIQDMEDVIMEGLRLLNLLEDKFRHNINILELVRTYLREVHRFKDYLDLLKKLKSETFKARHWEMLWNEMYASVATKPDPKTVTLKKLLEDKLFTYASLINTIYKNAQDEYNIEQEIENIEENLTKIKDLKTDLYDVGNQNQIYVLKGITQVLAKLNDHHYVIKNMLANPNYPRAFLDKLNNMEYVIRGMKKILRLSDRVQKKLYTIAPFMRHRFIASYFGKDHDHSTTYNTIQSQYKQQIEGILKKKMVFLVSLFDKSVMNEHPDMKHDLNGEDVIENLQKVIAKCELITSDFYVALKQARHTCPRLHILTDSHIIQYLSVAADPQEVIKDLSWVFTAVKELKIDTPSKQPFAVTGVVNLAHETLQFMSRVSLNPQEIDGSNFYLCPLLNDIEKEIKRAVKGSLIKAMPTFFGNGYNYRNNFKLVQEKTLLFQSLVLLNNLLFYHDLSMIIASKELTGANMRDTFVNNRLSMFKSNIEHNLSMLCESLAYERDKYSFLLLNQFIFHIKHQVDILNYIIEANVQNLESFEYLVLPKIMIEYSAKAIRTPTIMTDSVHATKIMLENISSIQDLNQLNAKSDYLHLYQTLDQSNFNIIFRSLNYKRNYGFDLVPFTEPTVLTPSTNRSYVSMLGALATQTGVLVNGLQDRGKKETIKGLAYMLGKEIFTVDQYSVNYDFFTQLIFGAVRGNFWIVFDNIQEYPHAILSTMAQQIHMIRVALANAETRIKYGSLTYDLRGDQNWGLFATYSLTQQEQSKSLDKIPKNFIENFRILNYLNPHLSHIISLYFELYGVPNPIQAANKVVTFFQILANATENQVFFLSESVSMEDIELVQALNIRPSMSLINKMIKQLQQMIISQKVLKIDVPEIWKAIKECVTHVAKEKAMKMLLNLFNMIFQADITESKETQEKEDKFKGLMEEYYAENQETGSAEFDKKCLQLFTIVKAPTSQYKTILISGRPGRGKTAIIDAVAKILSKDQSRNFCLNWIDMDSTPAVLVLGGKHENNRLQGIIPVLIDIAVNEMTPNDLRENEYDSLISHCSRWANPKTSDTELKPSQHHNWIILEGAYDQLHLETMDLVERLLAGKRQGMITALDGLKIRVPRTMSFIIECDKMNALNPANLADVALLSLETNSFSMRQEFNRRITALTKHSDFFLSIQSILILLFDELIEPIISAAIQDLPKNALLYYLSSNYLLLNFMSVFEIFLNECRKLEISFGNISDNEIERSEAQLEAKKLAAAGQPQPEDRKAKKVVVISKGDIMGIRHSMKLEAQPANAQGIDRQTLAVESTCIFTLIWTIGTLYRPDSRPLFSKLLLKKVKTYYKDSPLSGLEPPHPAYFPAYFGHKLEAKSIPLGIFDYCMDLHTQAWVPWKDYALPDYQEISPDFSGIRLPTNEVAKFNSLLKKSQHTKTFMDAGFIRTHLPTTNEQIFVHTETSKKLMFFLDYMLAYKKPVIVLSEYENGKTVVINQKLRLLLEHNSHKTFSFSLTPFTTKEQLSKYIQNCLVKNFKGSYSAPSDMDGLIFIDDMNLSSIEHRPWSIVKSFYSYKGWYNVIKGSFIKLDRVSFLTASSHSFLKTQNVFDESLSNLPQAFLHKMLLFYMPEMTSRDFKAIFREYSEPLMTESEGTGYLKTLKHYCNQLLMFNFRNREKLRTLSHLFGCNFTLANALQMFKSLHLWDWNDEMTIQNFTDLWFFSLKRTYSNQFGKVKDIPEEFLLNIDEENQLSKSYVSSLASPTIDLLAEHDDDIGSRKSIFNDPLKQSRDRRSKILPSYEKIELRGSQDAIQERLKAEHSPKTLGQIEEEDGAYSKNTLAGESETGRMGTGKSLSRKKLNVAVDKRPILEEMKDEETPHSSTKEVGTNEFEKQEEKSSEEVQEDNTSEEVQEEKTSEEVQEEKTSEEVQEEKTSEEGQSAGRPLLNLQKVQTPSQSDTGNSNSQEIVEERRETHETQESQEEQYNFNVPKRVIDPNIVKRRKSPMIKIDLAERPSIEQDFVVGGRLTVKVTKQSEPGSISLEGESSPNTVAAPRINLGSSSVLEGESQMEFLKPDSPGIPKRPEGKKQSQFARGRPAATESHEAPASGGRRRSVFSQVSIVPTESSENDDEDESVESATSIASSASDEEINALEKNLNMDENEELASFPYESLNIFSKILIFSNLPSSKMKKHCKVSHGVLQDHSFAFNTELLAVERHELNLAGFTPIFQLVSHKDETKKREIMQYIETQMRDHLPDNKSAIFFFNNFTFRLTTLLPHLSSLLLELQTPNQHLFLTSMSQPIYCYHSLKFASHLLAYRVATFYITPKKASNPDIHTHFINLFNDTVSISAHEGRKCVFAIVLDGFKPQSVDISSPLFSSVIRILQDLNAIILGASLKSILPRHQLKTLLTVLKKSETYGHFPESHLLYILSQIVSTNIKFVIVAEDEALQINNLTFRFEKHAGKLTLIELFLKYFPHSYVKFRKVILNDLQLSVDKNIIFNEDVFPLDLDEELCMIFQSSFNYEVQFGNIQDNQYGYSVIPNFRVAIMMADFVYGELKANLTSKADALKGTGHSLVGAIKKLRKRADMTQTEIKDLMRFIDDRKQELVNVEETIVSLMGKKEELSKELEDINKQFKTFENDLEGFNNEENILKKLQGTFADATNSIVTYNSKDFVEDVKFSKFFNSRFFTVYSILWCYIFNTRVEEDKVNADLDLSTLNLGNLTPEFVSGCTKEFTKVLSDFGQLKNKLLGLKFSNINRDNLAVMINIIKENNLAATNCIVNLYENINRIIVKFNKIQKIIMKWIDLVIETSKFELRKDFRIKEVKSIKALSEQLEQDMVERQQFIDQIEATLADQPKLQAQIRERIEFTEQAIKNLENAIEKMLSLSKNLEIVIKANFEMNNPIAANKSLYAEYIRATALYMVQGVKYSAKIRSYLFKLILNNMSSELNFNVHKLHHVLYGEAFLIDCLNKKVAMNLNFVDNLAVFDMVMELNLQFPLVIDPSGLFLNFMREKLGKGLVVEYFSPENLTISSIITAMESGCTLAIVDFNKDLLNLIEPILNWRYNQILTRIYNKHYYSSKKEDKDADFGDPDVVLNNPVQDQIEFNGAKYRIHQDFKLVLVVQNNSAHLSKFLLEKVFIINNDISSEATWCETVSDLLLIRCYPSEREAAIKQYYNERLFNEANEMFNTLSEKLKKVDFLGAIDVPMLDQLATLAETIKEKYRAQNMSANVTISELQSPDVSPGSAKKGSLKNTSTLFVPQVYPENDGVEESEELGIPRMEKSFSALQKSGSEFKRGLRREGSVKTSFFHQSQSIAVSSPKSKLKKGMTSLFLEGTKVQEYSNLFNGFTGVDLIIKRHQKLFSTLFLLKTTLQVVNKDIGSSYTFSEYHMISNVLQALDITILNGYLKNPSKPDESNKFETMVIFNAFHQLYSMFRKDHQNLFSFCFALLTLKTSKDFPQDIWRFFLYRKVALSSTQKMYVDPNTDRSWEHLGKFLIDYFNVWDNRVPPIVPFHLESSHFQEAQKLLLRITEEGSVFHKYIHHPLSEPQQISLDVPIRSKRKPSSTSPPVMPEKFSIFKQPQAFMSPDHHTTSIMMDKDVSLVSEANTSFQRKSKGTGTLQGIKAVDDHTNDFSPSFVETSIQGLDIPKIAKTSPTREDIKSNTNFNFHSNMREVLSKTPYKPPMRYDTMEKSSSIRFGDSPIIPKEAYNLSFSDSVEYAREEERMTSPQSKGASLKKSLFAKKASPVHSEAKEEYLEEKKVDPESQQDEHQIQERTSKDSLMKARSSSRRITGGNTTRHEDSPQDDEVVVENHLLVSLKKLIPALDGMIKDMEKNNRRWTEFLNKSMLHFKVGDQIFPQMPNMWSTHFSSLEIFSIMKCLRPDALEMFAQGFLGQTKHRSYYAIPRTNFESHSRTNWYRRPTLIFFGDEYRNPTEGIEMHAIKNRNQCFKISLGQTPLEIVFDELSKYAQSGKWYVIENLHLLGADQLPTFIKRINSELEGENTSSQFKLWITYYQEGTSYCTFYVSEGKRPFLEPFFRTCFKTYINVSDSVKARVMEFYKGSLMNYYAGVELDLESDEDEEKPELSKQQSLKTQVLVPFQKVKQHRLKLQQVEEKIDLYEIFQHKLGSNDVSENDIVAQKVEKQDQNAKVRFTTTFLFSIIRERFKYEKSLPANYFRNYTLFVSDNDLTDLLDDILDFVEKNELSPFTAVEKFFSLIFSYKTSSFMTFNRVNIQYLFRNFVANNNTFAPIQVKGVSYQMLKTAATSDAQVFQCIKGLPNEDPMQIFGYNVNNEILYSYKKSKSMVNFLLKCDKNINKKETDDNECNELEKLILNEKHEKELEVILEEYITIKNDQSMNHMDHALRLVSLIKKLIEFIPSPFDLKTINEFATYQPQSATAPKRSFLKPEGLGSLGSLGSHVSHGPIAKVGISIVSDKEEITLPIPLPGRRRPSVENVKDKMLSDAIKSTYTQKFKNAEKAEKARKYSFTVLDATKMPFVKSPHNRPSGDRLTPTGHDEYLPKTPKGSNRSSPLREERSFEQGRITNKEIFKNLILNEIKLYNKIVIKIKNDLNYALRVIQGAEIVENVHPSHGVVMALLKNELPESWYNIGALPTGNAQNLITFLKVLNIKCENLRVLIYNRECIMYPIIPLPKLFDPFFLFVSMIWGYCQQNEVPFNECELVLHNTRTRPMTQQNTVGGIYLNGLKVSGGRIHEKMATLDDEFNREFLSNLESMMVKVRRRTRILSYPDEDPCIPLMITPRYDKGQNVKGDIVNDYHEYMKKYTLDKVPKPSNKDDEKVYYTVRIPVVDPCSKMFTNYFHLELYLYVRSTKPQEYWQMKGTCVLLQVDI